MLETNQLHPMSKTPSTVTLNSIFSANTSRSSISNTPSESHGLSSSPNLSQQSFSGLTNLIQHKLQSKTVVMLVGLPGSGKSTICGQICDFMNTKGYSTLIYNAGNIRRAMSREFSDSEFFNPDNKEAADKREQYAKMCMDNMLEDLRENRVNIGFLDATNTTQARRQSMLSLIQNAGFEINNVFILDVSCTEERLINYNITSKAFNQDYIGKDIATSISDFKKRSKHYFRAFEPISDHELAGYGNVKHLTIGNGGKSYHTSESGSSDLCDEVSQLLIAFITNYFKLHGERYHAAVEEFYSFNFGKGK